MEDPAPKRQKTGDGEGKAGDEAAPVPGASAPAAAAVVLYSYWRSSCSWRVRIALALKGIDYEYKAVHLVKDGGQQLQDTYAAVNPMKEVPTLLIDGLTLKQSVPIIEYLDETRAGSGPALVPRGADAAAAAKRQKVRQLAELVSSGIQSVQNLRVLKYVMAMFDDAAVKQEKKVAWGRHWIAKGFEALERELAQCSGKYCVGDAVSLADICLVPQVYNANRFKVDMSRFPNIARINAALEQLPAFKAAAPDQMPDAQ